MEQTDGPRWGKGPAPWEAAAERARARVLDEADAEHRRLSEQWQARQTAPHGPALEGVLGHAAAARERLYGAGIEGEVPEATANE